MPDITIAQLTETVTQLTKALAALQAAPAAAPAGVLRTAPAQRSSGKNGAYNKPHMAENVKLKSFQSAPASLKKAAHNVAKQAQAKVSKKAPNYTSVYKSAYDCHLEENGHQGKYHSRDKRRAAQKAARKAA